MKTWNSTWRKAGSTTFCARILAGLWFCALVQPLAGAPAIQLLSSRDPSILRPGGGNGGSVVEYLSADGRFILFSSSACDLVANDNQQLGTDVFLRDTSSNSTTLVSVNSAGIGGGNAGSVFGQISTNGRYVLFESDASDLVLGDTNNAADIFVRDLQTGANELVSVAADGGCANKRSCDAAMTPDGQYVAFVSYASNLVPGDTNSIPDIFVRDLTTGTTRLVTVGAIPQLNAGFAFMGMPAITPDGRYVAYCSSARGLAPGIPSSSPQEVYVRDLALNRTLWASTNASALAAAILQLSSGLPSFHPSISDDGRFVCFKTGWSNPVTPPASGAGATVTFRYELTDGSTTVVDTNGCPASAWTWWNVDDPCGPEMTPDGRFIVFVKREGAGGNSCSVCRWDANSGTETLVSADVNGLLPTNSISHTPDISPDGRFVAFLSDATNLVANPVADGFHLYLRDIEAGTTRLIDVDTNGIASTDEEGMAFGMSADGRYVAFSSPDGRLVGADNNHAIDVLLRDTIDDRTELVSQRDATLVEVTGDGSSSLLVEQSMSADGRWGAFTSYAADLVPNDAYDDEKLIVRDLLTGTNILVRGDMNGSFPTVSAPSSPVLSGNGRFVAFVSYTSNLFENIFLHDIQAGTNVLVTVDTNGVAPGAGDSWGPVISQDGQYIAFLSQAPNLAPGFTLGASVFRRDTSLGVTRLLSPPGSSYPPSMSADGRYLAARSVSRFWVFDSQSGSNILDLTLSLPDSISGVCYSLSPDGGRLLYQFSPNGGPRTIQAADLTTGRTNIFSIPSKVSIPRSGQWSRDGRFFVVVTGSAVSPGDNNQTNDVYLCDLASSTVTLVSINAGAMGSANGPSDSPAVSGDGRFVVYRSFASDIITGPIRPTPNIFLYDRLTGSNTLVSAGSAASGWVHWVSRPAVNDNGSVVVFQSWDAGLVPGDFNRVQDVFAATFSPAVPIDSDGDGIPDEWMMRYFEHPTGQASDDSRAQDDADGDGMPNFKEYVAGTDPTSSLSVFRIRIALPAGPGDATLNWPAAGGRIYQVQHKESLADAEWQDLPGPVEVLGSQGYFTVPTHQPGGFYRALVRID